MVFYDAYGNPKPARTKNSNNNNNNFKSQETVAQNPQPASASWDASSWDSYWESAIASYTANRAEGRNGGGQKPARVQSIWANPDSPPIGENADNNERKSWWIKQPKESQNERRQQEASKSIWAAAAADEPLYYGPEKTQQQQQKGSYFTTSGASSPASTPKTFTKHVPRNDDEDWWVRTYLNNKGLAKFGIYSSFLDQTKDFLSDKFVGSEGGGGGGAGAGFTSWVAPQAGTTATKGTRKIPETSSSVYSSHRYSDYVEPRNGYLAWKDGPPVFPELKQQGVTVSGVARCTMWIFAFSAMFTLCYELLNYMKKRGTLADTVEAFERITGLNLSWLLIIFEVDPTEEYLRNTKKRQRVSFESIADASGHPLKGRSLFADRWFPKNATVSGLEKLGYGVVPPPTHSQQYQQHQSASAWASSAPASGVQDGWNQYQAEKRQQQRSRASSMLPQPVASTIEKITNVFTAIPQTQTTTTKLNETQVPASMNPDFNKKPTKPTKDPEEYLFNYHIKPRILYPTKADPDYPHLASLPTPIANVLDFSDWIWEAAVDTTAWTIGVTTVRPAQRVLKSVRKVADGVGEWVSWGERYGKQSVRRALGYSKKPVIEEIVSTRKYA